MVASGQGDFAALIGVSRRTVQRWDASGGVPSAGQIVKLARAVHPHDRALSARLARGAGTSLEELGIEPVASAPADAHMVDSITCAAADAMNMVPEAVRPALRAAFERARDLRMSPADVAAALAQTDTHARAKRVKP